MQNAQVGTQVLKMNHKVEEKEIRYPWLLGQPSPTGNDPPQVEVATSLVIMDKIRWPSTGLMMYSIGTEFS
jgi:hypothetical protein